ncbi:MAG TPA: hypothetical protein PK954_15635, partial [Anaerolineales bacterium]|nr:hypothetical protein [Anaerolineales bacterium]
RPEAQLAIAGSPSAYQVFDAVPETRKLFLPMVGPDDFPYLLAHFDALLVPVRERDHAALGNDQRLMEAGARGLPPRCRQAAALFGRARISRGPRARHALARGPQARLDARVVGSRLRPHRQIEPQRDR